MLSHYMPIHIYFERLLVLTPARVYLFIFFVEIVAIPGYLWWIVYL
jgi:hypothetical protein